MESNVMTEGRNRDGTVSEHWPVKSSTAWYVAGCLIVALAIGFFDRMIIALLIEPLTQSIELNNQQSGLLLGAAFAVPYALAVFPIASWIDRGNRVFAVAMGIGLAGVATVLSGFISNFWELLLARSLLAVAEAALTPASMSLIGDLFAPNKRAFPTAIYGATPGITGALAFLLGGSILAMSASLVPDAQFEHWRVTFVAVGVPAVLLALVMFLTVKEPVRQHSAAQLDGQVGLFALLKFLGRHWLFFLCLYAGIALVTMCTLGLQSWLPTLLVRDHGRSVAEAGFLVGATALPASVLAILVWPKVLAVFAKRGWSNGSFIAFALAALVATAASVSSFSQQNISLVLSGFFVAQLNFASVSMLPLFIIQIFGPPDFRARLVALYVIAAILFGQALGPQLVVLFAPQAVAGSLSTGVVRMILLCGSTAFGVLVLGAWAARTMPLADKP